MCTIPESIQTAIVMFCVAVYVLVLILMIKRTRDINLNLKKQRVPGRREIDTPKPNINPAPQKKNSLPDFEHTPELQKASNKFKKGFKFPYVKIGSRETSFFRCWANSEEEAREMFSKFHNKNILKI